MDEFDQPPEPIPPPEPPETIAPPPPVPPLAAAPPSPYYVPNQDERTFAILSHALQMPGWWIAPLIILLVKKESKFVKFHATQVLLLQAFYFAIMITVMVIFFATVIAAIPRGGTANMDPPVGMLMFMPFVWLVMFGMYVLIFVFTILYSIKAGKGEWAEYPVLGRLAKYMLNM